MAKKFLHRSALVLALTVLAVPTGRMYAQSSGAPVVTGGNPMPTGEDVSTDMTALLLLSAISNG
jgi:hypothetical protein